MFASTVVSFWVWKKCLAKNVQNSRWNSIIPQTYSWGQLSITQEACQKILSWHRVFVSFLDVIHSFGFKKSANDDILRSQSYHSYLSTGLNTRQPYLYGTSVPSQLYHPRLISISELCYIVQYVEKNGRDRGDPWSLRQTGVYEQVDIHTGKSVWIILQPSSSTQQCLEQGLQTLGQDSNGRITSNPMLFHAIFLLATADNWVGYIKYLHTEADEMVSRTHYLHITCNRADMPRNSSFADFAVQKGWKGMFFKARDWRRAYGEDNDRLCCDIFGHPGTATTPAEAASDVYGAEFVSWGSESSWESLSEAQRGEWFWISKRPCS